MQLAFEAHDGQKRRSGEPFIIHPVEVARILGEHVSNRHDNRYLFQVVRDFIKTMCAVILFKIISYISV